LVRTWVNGIGPFNFAIDTGAGATLLSPRVAGEAHVTGNGRVASVGGLSGATRAAYHASLRSLAIGDIENNLPASGEVLITSGLPADLDGVFDPTEALWPLGYTIDIPHHEFSAFDPNVQGLRRDQAPAGEGAVVAWLRESQGRRPFVMLDNGDRALLDTGSSLGFAVRDTSAAGARAHTARDVGGGQISARRGTTATIAIGSLVLRKIPTDFVSGTEADAPTLLGLAALRPFRLSFDPVHRLIEISAQ
jgi:predicted aspartyl protease